METILDTLMAIAEQIPFNEEEAKERLKKKYESLNPEEESQRYEKWLQRKPRTPKEAAIMDMRAEGIDVSVLRLRKTVIVTEIEECIFCSVDDGRILNGGIRVKRTVHSTTL